MAEKVTVSVKPASESKINWTQFVSMGAMLLTYFGLPLSPEQQAGIIMTIGVVGDLFTWIMKTWFTSTVTPQSVGKA